MEIRGRDSNGWSVLELDGFLDLHSTQILKNVFKQISLQDKNVVLDFTNLKKIDSTGVSCLMYCQSILVENEKVLRLASVNDSVKVILQITRGYEVFDIYDSVQVAEEELSVDKNLKDAA